MTDPVRPFLPVLRRVDRQLRVALPVRLRILRELEFDLQGLSGTLERDGVPRVVAWQRAVDALAPGDQALHALGALHRPLYLRVTGHVDGDRLRRVERSALTCATALVMVTQALLLARTGLLTDASPFLWPVLGLGAVTFALAVRAVFGLHVQQDWNDGDGTLWHILFAAALTLCLGLAGSAADLYYFASAMEVTSDPMATAVTAWLIRECTLVAVAILIAVGGALSWFVLAQRAASIHAERGRLLGRDAAHPVHPIERSPS